MARSNEPQSLETQHAGDQHRPLPPLWRIEMKDEKLVGTFACPICGRDTPHSHSEDAVQGYRSDSIRDDGWVSAAYKQPEERGWYLCLDVKINLLQYGDPPKMFSGSNELYSQLWWFNWVRSGGEGSTLRKDIPEVLYFEGAPSFSWRLRNLLGNASVSGAESRRTVMATPKYWRQLPPIVVEPVLTEQPK